MGKLYDILLIVLVAIAVAALIVFMPFSVIWAINTLFGLGIPFTFWTWAAICILCVVFNAPTKRST